MKPNEALIFLLKNGPVRVGPDRLYVDIHNAFEKDTMTSVPMEVSELAAFWDAWNADVYHFGYIEWVAKKLNKRPLQSVIDTFSRLGLKVESVSALQG